MQAMSFGYGKASFAICSVSLAAFRLHAPFERTIMNTGLQRQGQTQRFPASTYPEINGTMFLETLRVPDNALVLLQASYRHLGKPIKDGAIVLRTRESGPLLSVHASIPHADESTLNPDFLVMSGRADVLDFDQLSDYGIEVKRSYAEGFMDPDEVAQCFTVSVVAHELRAAQGVQAMQDAEGKVVLVQTRPVRQLRNRNRDRS